MGSDFARYLCSQRSLRDSSLTRMLLLCLLPLVVAGNGTHRYQVQRHARKLGARAFSPSFRLAPQYPFPCSLQDALAAYLYLIDPPDSAKIDGTDDPPKAIHAHNIVLYGDSSGGALALSLLVVLRDAGLPMPAGCVLMSPWVDLTHSFPSVM